MPLALKKDESKIFPVSLLSNTFRNELSSSNRQLEEGEVMKDPSYHEEGFYLHLVDILRYKTNHGKY